ncbi:MAG: hypothetical protein ACI9YL_001460 [Luteibaculaceae bacterium]|jgi:hypothetical protein
MRPPKTSLGRQKLILMHHFSTHFLGHLLTKPIQNFYHICQMNQNLYFSYIEEKLQTLSKRIESRGKLNLLDLHVHSENFYLHLFNKLYGFELENMNAFLQNVEAIDLIDNTNKIIIQVSATSTKRKIEDALKKNILAGYKDYSFKFVSISKDASDLRNKSFTNPYGLTFAPATDIYDINSILNYINSKSADETKPLYGFIKSELGNDIDMVKLDSNLASIINILSNEEWSNANKVSDVNTFEIERKIIHNKLTNSRVIIEQYALFNNKVDSKYKEFDKLGANKSNSVLGKITREFLKVFDSNDTDKSFQNTVDIITEKVIESANYASMPLDELELCVEILVVDAFIRCKIFENPVNYDYATT